MANWLHGNFDVYSFGFRDAFVIWKSTFCFCNPGTNSPYHWQASSLPTSATFWTDRSSNFSSKLQFCFPFEVFILAVEEIARNSKHHFPRIYHPDYYGLTEKRMFGSRVCLGWGKTSNKMGPWCNAANYFDRRQHFSPAGLWECSCIVSIFPGLI